MHFGKESSRSSHSLWKWEECWSEMVWGEQSAATIIGCWRWPQIFCFIASATNHAWHVPGLRCLDFLPLLLPSVRDCFHTSFAKLCVGSVLPFVWANFVFLSVAVNTRWWNWPITSIIRSMSTCCSALRAEESINLCECCITCMREISAQLFCLALLARFQDSEANRPLKDLAKSYEADALGLFDG